MRLGMAVAVLAASMGMAGAAAGTVATKMVGTDLTAEKSLLVVHCWAQSWRMLLQDVKRLAWQDGETKMTEKSRWHF